MGKTLLHSTKKFVASFLALAGIALLWTNPLHAQVTGNCPNLDFEEGDFTNWTGFIGMYQTIDTVTATGIVPGRHTIISTPGFDPNTGNNLPVIAPGSTISVQLGNDAGGRQAEKLQYVMSVDTTNALFVYRYAIVMQDPGHPVDAQPTFEVAVLDSNGILLDSVCGFNLIIADSSLPGFNSHFDTNGFGGVSLRAIYSDWLTAGMDLTPFIGQDITLQFTTRDCDFGAHFGYAYIDGFCGPLEIITQFCLGQTDSIQLTAPPGFLYQWSNGDSTQSIKIPTSAAGQTFTAVLTSPISGCQVTLTATTDPTSFEPGFTFNSCGITTFTDTSRGINGDVLDWQWDFGDGDSSNLANPTHQYNTPGQYNVTLVVGNGLGCFSDTVTTTVDVFFAPVAAFDPGVDTVCQRQNISFSDSTLIFPNSPAVDYLWFFGDGDSATVANPIHQYDTSGTFTITLITSVNDSCFTTATDSVTVLPLPEPQFTADTLARCVPLTTTFLDTTDLSGTATIISRSWDFGNGSTLDSALTATVLYDVAGFYDVSLTITTSDGCTGTLTKSAYIEAYANPVAGFTAQPNPVYITDPTIIFTDLSTETDQWLWLFGDTATGSLDSSTLASPSHTYSSGGFFTVYQFVTTQFGCTDSTSQVVEVIDDFLVVPNVFTPNNDGVGDLFLISAITTDRIEGFEFKVFNRWGQKVFQSSILGEGWNGRITGREASEGTYYWTINYRAFNGELRELRGDLTLLR